MNARVGAVTNRLRQRAGRAVETLRVRPLVAVGRVALWGAVMVVVVRGTLDVFIPQATPAAPAPTAASASAEYPTGPAMAFAARFATDYLSFDETAGLEERRARLDTYLAEGATENWAATGTQQVTTTVPAGVSVTDARTAVVTVAAQVGAGRWVHLAVPVTAGDGGRLAVAGSPALVAAPGRAELPETPAEAPAADPAAAEAATPALEAFFRAYGAGAEEDLAYYLAAGRRLDVLGGDAELVSVDSVRVGSGPGTREATVTVTWADPDGAATFAQTYRLRLVESGGRFYVDDLGPDTPAATTKEQQSNDR